MIAALAIVMYVVMHNKMYALLATLPAMFFSLMPSVIVLNKINREIHARPPVQ